MKRLPLLCLILFILVGLGEAQKKAESTCKDIPMKLPIKVFAAFDGGKWRRYPSVKAIPAKAEAAFDRAEVFRAPDGRYKIHMLNSSEETGMFNDYCFASDGKLIEIKSDFSGIWSWGARREFRMENGKLKESPTIFYDVDTGKVINKPEYDASLDEFREVKIYKTISELPFNVADLSNRTVTTAPTEN